MKAADIMNNIIQLAELLDEQALQNAGDIPFLELAKSVSIKKPECEKGHPQPAEPPPAERR